MTSTSTPGFDKFAKAILRVYRRDKEAFWAAVLAPFLASQVSLGDWWQHLKVDVELLGAFRGLDDDYWRVFLLFGAAIQMIDDWEDLEGDLAVGHFSYVTLGAEQLLNRKDPRGTARRLREDRARVRATYDRSKAMIAEARTILARLEDVFLVRLVDITELRLDRFFRKELKLE